jgi:hypothetical protein
MTGMATQVAGEVHENVLTRERFDRGRAALPRKAAISRW